MKKHIHCPMDGWNCPYYAEDQCTINNPMAKCDIFTSTLDDEEDEKYYSNWGKSEEYYY